MPVSVSVSVPVPVAVAARSSAKPGVKREKPKVARAPSVTTRGPIVESASSLFSWSTSAASVCGGLDPPAGDRLEAYFTLVPKLSSETRVSRQPPRSMGPLTGE